MSDSQIVLSGMRSTGKLHLGHLFGTLHNWVELQEKHRCFFFAADWHALTSDYADPSRVTENTIEALADWIAAGIDPEKSVVFVQSMVPEHAELTLWLSWWIGLGRLERNPTLKAEMADVEAKLDAVPVAFFHVKAAWEERRLAQRYDDYPAYARRTGRFVPRVPH